MADFCEQCAAGLDFPNDFAGATKLGDQMASLYALVLCEGCGAIQVDWRGRCISETCLEGHTGIPHN